MSRTRRQWFYILILLIIIVIIVHMSTNRNTTTRKQSAAVKLDFNFIPAGFVKGKSTCEELFVGSSARDFQMSSEYKLRSSAFLVKAEELGKTDKTGPEGHSHQFEEQFRSLHYFASNPSARRICETGFNVGHSSFTYLTASSDSKVYSFDLGLYNFSRPMALHLTEMFPARLQVIFGDSTKTVPKFIAEQPADFRCDVMLVDGGHQNEVALADIVNFAKLANLENNVIIFDDYPSSWGWGMGQGWEKMIQEGVIQERMRCTFGRDAGRGFCIGQVVKRPVTS